MRPLEFSSIVVIFALIGFQQYQAGTRVHGLITVGLGIMFVLFVILHQR